MSLLGILSVFSKRRPDPEGEKRPLVLTRKTLFDIDRRKSGRMEREHDVSIPAGSYIACSSLEIGCFTKMNGPVIMSIALCHRQILRLRGRDSHHHPQP